MFVPSSITEEMMFATVRISGRNGAGEEVSAGTGFYYNVPSDVPGRSYPALITNKHVIEGVEQLYFLMHTKDPSNLKMPHGNRLVDIPPKNWIHHPDPKVDLCGVFVGDLVEKLKGFTRAFDQSIIWSTEKLWELNAVEDILMIGYPNGLWDEVNNFPLIRRGITASHPALDFMIDGFVTTVIDAACFPGSSGSPVVIHSTGTLIDKRGNVRVGATRTIFLGALVSGPQIKFDGKIVNRAIPTTDDREVEIMGMLNLGYLVKAREILVLGEEMRRIGSQRLTGATA